MKQFRKFSSGREICVELFGTCAVLTALLSWSTAAHAAGSEASSAQDRASPSSSVASPTAPQVAPAPKRRFEINAIDVVGNTVLDEAVIDEAIEPYLGPDKTVEDIEAARGSLEKAYQSRGFQTVYVIIPKQTVRDGVVKLQAVETKIGQVAIKGQDWSSKKQVEDALPSLRPGAIPNLNDLNKELVALNSQSRDLQVTPAMKQGAAPGTIDVDLGVEDQLAVHGGVEINNRYSRDTHQYRLQANASYDDLWHLGHSISGLYSVAPEDRADGEVYALTYSAPIPGTSVKLSLTGLKSNSNVTTLGSTDVLGKGQSLSLSATMPLGTLGSYFHYVQLGFAYKHFTDTVSLGGQRNAAPITYYPISVTYVGSWQDALDQVSGNASLNFSFRGLGSNEAAFDYSRYRADGDFVYVRGGLNWLRTLPWDFQAYGELDGQVANRPLVSNEQFSVGGDGSVRGYLQSEGLGDNGIRGTVELRSPSLAPYLHMGSAISDLRLVGFFDAARAYLLDPLPGQQSLFSLRSTGIGVTTSAFDHLNGSLYVAWPLRASAGNGLSGSTWYGDERIQFRVWTQF